MLVDQFIDRTFARDKSFFGAGCVAHVSVAHPVCQRLGAACARMQPKMPASRSIRAAPIWRWKGPQFSSLAESRMYREQWGADVIGMTNMPEAKLAREAEICYAPIAMVTDYDSWHPQHGEVDVTEIIKTLTANTAKAKALDCRAARHLRTTRDLPPWLRSGSGICGNDGAGRAGPGTCGQAGRRCGPGFERLTRLAFALSTAGQKFLNEPPDLPSG